jgi:DNA polymerase III alpha subunit
MDHFIFKGLIARFVRKVPDDKRYILRLRREFELVSKFNFTNVFLMVRDILDLAGSDLHIIRGSASCSLICYLLGISHIDPIANNIRLARFMNDFRKDLPDIDIDISHKVRDKLFAAIYAKWPNQVARISNKVKYRYKSAIHQAMRQCGYKGRIPRNVILSKLMPHRVDDVINKAAKLIGKRRLYSLHCGGIIFFKDDVPSKLKIGRNQIKYDKNDVEDKGLLKIDILSNRALSQLRDLSDRPLSDYPEKDEQISALFATGDVIGLTFAESPTFIKASKAVKPTNVEELSIALALIRPAAASRGKKSSFLDNWLYNRTINQIVFEDDAINKIMAYLNCSEDQADHYRDGFAKGKRHVIEAFFEKARGMDGLQTLASELSQLRMYSFCKGHAINYAQLVWALAYHKTRNPAEFWESAINNCQSMYRTWVHVEEAKRAGCNITAGSSGRPVILKSDGLKQGYLFQPDPLIEFQHRGFWEKKDFFPDSFFDRGTTTVALKGLIGTQKKHKGNTFLSVGIGGGKYYDAIVPTRIDVRCQDMLIGEGTSMFRYDHEVITVKKYKLVKFINGSAVVTDWMTNDRS